MSRIPTLVLLAVALFTGVVPLRRCHARDGGAGGVVPLGQHGHTHDAHDASGCAHGHAAAVPHEHEHGACTPDECGCDPHDSAPATHDGCCVDTPFDAGLASESVTLAPPAILPPTAWTGAGEAAAPLAVPTWVRPAAPPEPLRSVRNTVLLR